MFQLHTWGASSVQLRESDQFCLNIGTGSQAMGVWATLIRACIYYDKMNQY